MPVNHGAWLVGICWLKEDRFGLFAHRAGAYATVEFGIIILMISLWTMSLRRAYTPCLSIRRPVCSRERSAHDDVTSFS